MEETVGKHLTTGQIRELIDIDRSRGGIHDEVQQLIRRLTFGRGADIIWVGAVLVDYDTRPTYQELNGVWFDWANESFKKVKPELRDLAAKPLPQRGIVRHHFGYVHLNRNATDEQALAGIANRGMIPASDLELMYFGKAFPEEQRQHPVVALRSFFRIDSDRGSAVLCKNDRERHLDLCFGAADCPWRDFHHFLVREDVA